MDLILFLAFSSQHLFTTLVGLRAQSLAHSRLSVGLLADPVVFSLSTGILSGPMDSCPHLPGPSTTLS